MTVVFDKENAISFFKSIDNSEFGHEIMQLLKRQVNLQFNFELEDTDEMLELQILEFVETGGRKDNNLSIIFNNNEAYQSPFCVDQISNTSNVYLLNTISEKVKRAYKVLIGTVGDELDILSKLLLNQIDRSTHEQRIIGSDNFKDWSYIAEFIRPFSQVLIVDRFMFKGPEIGGNLGLFDYNIKVILQKLYANQMEKTDIVFVYQINPNVARTHSNYDEGPDLEKLGNKVKQAVKSVNRNCPKPNLTFIGVPKGRINDDHDRHIITNYIRIKSGDSLIYFNSTGKIETKSNEFDVYSLGRKQYRDTTKSLISKIKRIIHETLEKHSERCYVSQEDKEHIIKF